MADPRSDQTFGYHLFFEPKEPLASSAAALIKSISAQSGAPVFMPHATLLAEIPESPEEELIEKTKNFAQIVKLPALALGEIGMEDAYYRALYIRIKEQAPLKNLHIKAAEDFGMQPKPAYLAHVSLLYGNYPAEKKLPWAENLSIPVLPFEAASLSLWHTPGTVNTWKKVYESAF